MNTACIPFTQPFFAIFASSHFSYFKKIFFSFLLSKIGLLIALSYGITNLSFNWAIAEGNVVRVVFLFYLMPIWASIFAAILIKEKPSLTSVIAIAIATGAFLILIYDQWGTTLFQLKIFKY